MFMACAVAEDGLNEVPSTDTKEVSSDQRRYRIVTGEADCIPDRKPRIGSRMVDNEIHHDDKLLSHPRSLSSTLSHTDTNAFSLAACLGPRVLMAESLFLRQAAYDQ